jgi:hypothetical protein
MGITMIPSAKIQSAPGPPALQFEKKVRIIERQTDQGKLDGIHFWAGAYKRI